MNGTNLQIGFVIIMYFIIIIIITILIYESIHMD